MSTKEVNLYMSVLNRASPICVSLCFLLVVGCAAQPASFGEPEAQAVAAWLEEPANERGRIETLVLPSGMSKQASADSLERLWAIYRQSISDEELGELPPTHLQIVEAVRRGGARPEPGALTIGEFAMPFHIIRRESQAPDDAGRALFISTHGGGQNPRAQGAHAWDVNTREWQSQTALSARLYEPDGIYFVPRMADDRMGRWWHRHNQAAFDRVITHAIAHWGVDPNRVYKLGISEGGYGTAILTPFMPDRFAGANAMAGGVDQGNPPRNLRNLAFRTDIGEGDTRFERAPFAIAFHKRLEALHEQDPGGYVNSIAIQRGRGHGIDYKPGVSWIAQHTRNPWPRKLTWLGKELHGQRRDRHYWVQIVGELGPRQDPSITALVHIEQNTIEIVAEQLEIRGDSGSTHAKVGEVVKAEPLQGVMLRVLLHDQLLDLDQSVQIVLNGKVVHDGLVERSVAAQLQTLLGYGDPTMAASAELLFMLNE